MRKFRFHRYFEWWMFYVSGSVTSNFQTHNRLPNLKLVSAINNPSECVPVCDKTRWISQQFPDVNRKFCSSKLNNASRGNCWWQIAFASLMSCLSRLHFYAVTSFIRLGLRKTSKSTRKLDGLFRSTIFIEWNIVW